MRMIPITEASLEMKRERGALKECTAYIVDCPAKGWKPGLTMFAFTPDGIGFYWYNTEQELLWNHG